MPHSNEKAAPVPEPQTDQTPGLAEPAGEEIGGRGGLEPTRFGDWEKNGRCIDF